MRLRELAPEHVRSWQAVLLRTPRRFRDGPLSTTTVRYCQRLLRRELQDALRRDLIDRNVCDAVVAPRRAETEMSVWSPPDVRRFLVFVADEFAGTENKANCVAFLERAVAWFAARGSTIERIVTDNGNGDRSRDWERVCAELNIRHTRTRPYHPATKGKVERFNRTLLDEWAYARAWTSDRQRARTLDRWLHRYNHHRYHTAIGGPPTSRVTNLIGHNA